MSSKPINLDFKLKSALTCSFSIFVCLLVVFNKSIFQIVLHAHNEEPNVMDSGYLVPPGTTTYIPIERKEVQS